MKQVIYIDVLIFLNTIITFLLLLASSRLMKLTPSAGRFVLGSVIGGASSLIIFAPDMGLLLSLITKLLFSVIITTATYNPKTVRAILRQTGYFFAVSFIFAGIMLFVSSLEGISIVSYNNGAVYIDFSFFSLIAASTLCYIITVVLNKLTRHKNESGILYNIRISKDGKTVSYSAILDTGNGLTDPFSGDSIIIADTDIIKNILPNDIILYFNGESEKCSSLRLVPCSTVTDDSLLPVFRADSATVNDSGKHVYIDRPLIAVTQQKLSHIIIPPDIFTNAERRKTDEKAVV